MPVRVINSTSLRRNLADVLGQAAGARQAILIKRRNRADVALVDAEYLEDLLLLHDEEYRTSIAKARADVRAGRLFSHEEIFGE